MAHPPVETEERRDEDGKKTAVLAGKPVITTALQGIAGIGVLTAAKTPRRPAAGDMSASCQDVCGEPDRIRTCDPLIKSQLLYQLSYRPHEAAD
jgi:hypothetical protein